MGRAEVGSPKYIANKFKSKGLQRLRWYCQVCEKQCRDENGFKCHTQSESHLRRVLQVGRNGNPSIEEYSRQFKRDFVYLLRTSHGEKPTGLNKFYNEYIQNRDHVHMNATRWSSLRGFAQSLADAGICTLDDAENGGTISWIDTSLDAGRTKQEKDAERKSETEERARALERQIAAAHSTVDSSQNPEPAATTVPERDVPLSFALGAKKTFHKPETRANPLSARRSNPLKPRRTRLN